MGAGTENILKDIRKELQNIGHEIAKIGKAMQGVYVEEAIEDELKVNCMRCTYLNRETWKCTADHCKWDEENDDEW